MTIFLGSMRHQSFLFWIDASSETRWISFLFTSKRQPQRFKDRYRCFPLPMIMRIRPLGLYVSTLSCFAERRVVASASSAVFLHASAGKTSFMGSFPRGGASIEGENDDSKKSTTSRFLSSDISKAETEYVTLSEPAPGSPFHHAFPVHSLRAAKHFYGTVLGCKEGRSSEKWQDYSLHGHQIVAHWVGNDYRCVDYTNPVDGDDVPVPHTGLALTVEEFHALMDRLRQHSVKFIIEPHLRFKGMPGEQYTAFFKDPSGNNLEFKAMTHPQNLFAKYNVEEG